MAIHDRPLPLPPVGWAMAADGAAGRLGNDTPPGNRIPCHLINSHPFNMADVCPALGRPIGGRLAVCATIYRRLASIIGNIDGRFLGV